jgi:hypothetical protein
VFGACDRLENTRGIQTDKDDMLEIDGVVGDLENLISMIRSMGL